MKYFACNNNKVVMERDWENLLDGKACFEKALKKTPLLSIYEESEKTSVTGDFLRFKHPQVTGGEIAWEDGSLLFPKDKWNVARAEKWVKEQTQTVKYTKPVYVYKDDAGMRLTRLALEESIIPLKGLKVHKLRNLLQISGTFFAAGTWRGIDGHEITYSKELVARDYKSLLGAKIKGSMYKPGKTHNPDQDMVIGVVTSVYFEEKTGQVKGTALIFDPKAVLFYSALPHVGWSVEAAVQVEEYKKGKFNALKFNGKRVSLVGNPACKTCWVDPTSVKIVNSVQLAKPEYPILDILYKLVAKVPFGPYKDHKDCVAKNQKAKDPDAYCAEIAKKAGKKKEEKHSDPQLEDNKMEDKLATLLAEFEKKMEDKLNAIVDTTTKVVSKAFEDRELLGLEAKLKEFKRPKAWAKMDYEEKKDLIEYQIKMKERAPIIEPEAQLEAIETKIKSTEETLLEKEWGVKTIDDVIKIVLEDFNFE